MNCSNERIFEIFKIVTLTLIKDSLNELLKTKIEKLIAIKNKCYKINISAIQKFKANKTPEKHGLWAGLFKYFPSSFITPLTNVIIGMKEGNNVR